MPAGDFPAWARRWSEAPLVFPLPPIRRELLPLMFVITEHRAWVRQIERHLRQDAPVPAMEHQDACAFADWLRTRAGHLVHDAALLDALLQRHDALHACAARLLALHRLPARMTSARCKRRWTPSSTRSTTRSPDASIQSALPQRTVQRTCQRLPSCVTLVSRRPA
jgi:hypothetical protein